ncbi:hypothetical protein CO2235_150257 [Cupriavidus oxalaticus]|uniref:Uncharacterized protein n=1 Tax=Cupriavidus oxalaticus TaxID=96344 RepID=A0A375G1H3_9BURK|nr:hypothetical protein CO2235_150257 [Cupriavidus oxalaticus]
MAEEGHAAQHRLPAQAEGLGDPARNQRRHAQPQEAHHRSEHQRAARRGRGREIPGQRQRAHGIDAAQQHQLVEAPAGPAEEDAAEHVEAADHAQRLRAEHRVHAADIQVRRQVRGQEDQLHAADEIRQRHDDERRVPQRRAQRLPRIALVGADECGQRQLVHAPRHPGRRQHHQRQQHERGQPGAPAVGLRHHLPDRRRQQRPERAGPRHQPQHRAAQRRRHWPCRHRHRQRAAGAGHRSADRHPRAQRDADHALRGRQQHQPGHIRQRAGQHQRPEADPRGPCARQRLQQAPGEVLHGDGHGEVGDRDADVPRQRRHEDAQALAQAHGQAEHHGGAKQDRQGRTEAVQAGRRGGGRHGGRLAGLSLSLCARGGAWHVKHALNIPQGRPRVSGSLYRVNLALGRAAFRFAEGGPAPR